MAQVISSLSEQALSLQNDQFLRRFIFASQWNKIRIGCRIAFDRAGAFTGGIAMGVCAGLRGYRTDGGANSDIVGGHWGATLFGSSYSVSSNAVSQGGASTRAFSNLAGTVNQTAGAGTTIYLSAVSFARSLWFVDITKGTGGSWTVQNWCHTSLAVATSDISSGQFLGLLVTETPSTTFLSNAGAVSVAYGGAGFLDGVILISKINGDNAWNIYDLNVVRFS